MKKLKLNLDNFLFDEILNRDQLKNVLGGDPPASSGGCPSKACVVVKYGESRSGNCESGWGGGSGTVMPCSCATSFGVYETATGTYGCSN